MSIAIVDERHDVETLERHLSSLQRRMRRVLEGGQLDELIPIWKRPGWTTPAEFFLVREALVGLGTQMRLLEKNIALLVEGAELVGAEFQR